VNWTISLVNNFQSSSLYQTPPFILVKKAAFLYVK
jgi:hypothetical protein